MRLLVKVLNQKRIETENRLASGRFGQRLTTPPHGIFARVCCRVPRTIDRLRTHDRTLRPPEMHLLTRPRSQRSLSSTTTPDLDKCSGAKVLSSTIYPAFVH